MSRRHAWRLSALCCAVMFAALPAGAQPGSQLGGYDARASAMAFSFQPVFPALIPTGDAPVEGTLALATGSVRSGGVAFGRASLVWPGSAAADLGPLLGPGFDQEELGALIPTWPLQAQATQEDGEVTTGVAPAVTMRAIGREDRGAGDARVADLEIPGIIHVEHVASTADTVVTEASLSSVARVTLRGVELLEGHITIEELRSVSRTTSNGRTGTSEGRVDLVGMKVGAIEVSVTDEGFVVGELPPDAEGMPGAGERFPGQSPEEQVQAILENLGARLTMFRGAGSVKDGRAEHMELGMVVSIDNPAGGQGPIPPGRFDLILASSVSSAFASPPFTFVPDDDPGAPLGAQVQPTATIGAGPTVAPATPAAVGERLAAAEVSAPPPVGAAAPVAGFGDAVPLASDYVFDGVPMGLVIGLLALSVLAARYIRNFFASMISTESGVFRRRGE